MQRQNIQKLKPYTCARDLFKTGIFLDANENPNQWVQIDWNKINQLNRYPDSTAEELRQKLVDTYLTGFAKEQIFIGSGSDEIIDLIIRGFVEDNEFVMTMDPSYSIYQVQADINNKKTRTISLKPDFSLDIDSITNNLDLVKVIFLCSPNNPTGNLIKPDEVEKTLQKFNGLLVIDEAYIEFASLENSLVSFVQKYPNVIVLRTFSKAWGLAGIRLGYSISSSEVVDVLLKIKDSYNVSKVSQQIAIQALDQIDGLFRSVAEVMENKSDLERKLENLGFQIIPTTTNFILARTSNATEVYKQVCKQGVIIRDRSNLPFLDGVLRISVGTKEENERLVKVLKDVLMTPPYSSPKKGGGSRINELDPSYSLIWDMDGVLIDVSKSYLEAIRRTAEIVTKTKVAQQQVSEIKKFNGLNNDWDATYVLVQQIQDFTINIQNLIDNLETIRTSELYQSAKVIFQNIYLGNKLFEQTYKITPPIDQEVGLIDSSEELLISREELLDLKNKFGKMAIATGRPKAEAQFTLTKFGIIDLFDSVVTMEDTVKWKPNPDPILKVIDQLKLKKPIYIGDSPSDVEAAKRAGIEWVYVGD